ncbi:MAG TPA: cytochrome C oxidase subunit I [Burkholderiaceae bacterium]|nr:cytochrome C oxidase subunit I [Burkholderiaceae bacterium]
MNMSLSHADAGTAAAASRPRKPRRVWTLWVLLAICLAPVVASYLAYYVFNIEARNNYGDLIEPQRDFPSWPATTLDGQPFDLASLRGRWIMLSVDSGACDEACAKRLYVMRQVRATTGKERNRIERVWIATDQANPIPALVAAHEGLHMLRVDPAPIRAFLPTADGTRMEDHIYLIDPLGHLMMRWPKDVDPNRMKKDVSKLLRASRIG